MSVKKFVEDNIDQMMRVQSYTNRPVNEVIEWCGLLPTSARKYTRNYDFVGVRTNKATHPFPAASFDEWADEGYHLPDGPDRYEPHRAPVQPMPEEELTVTEMRALLNGIGDTVDELMAGYDEPPRRARRVSVLDGDTRPDEVDVDEVYNAMETIRAYTESHDPIISTLTYEAGDGPLILMLPGCFHFGGRYTFHREARRRIRQALDVGAKLIMGGDDIDGFSGFFNRKSDEDQLLSNKNQRRLFEALIDEVGPDKIIASFSGQHGGWWDERVSGENRIKSMFTARDIPYFDAQGYIRLNVGEQQYHLAAAHKFPGGSMHNPNHPHVRALKNKFPNADMIVQWDKHQIAIQQRQVYQWEHMIGNRPSPYVWFVQAGTAKAGPDVYSMRGWAPGQFEWPLAVLWGDEHRVEVRRSLDEVLALLRM